MALPCFDEEFKKIKDEFEKVKSKPFPVIDLTKFMVDLPKDPSLEGLFNISNKIQDIQTKKNNLLLSYELVNEVALDSKKLARALNELHEMAKNNIIVSQKPTVEGLKNQMLQTAFVENQLQELLDLQREVGQFQDTTQTYSGKLYRMLENLQSSNENLSRQLTVVDKQILIGEIIRREKPLQIYAKRPE